MRRSLSLHQDLHQAKQHERGETLFIYDVIFVRWVIAPFGPARRIVLRFDAFSTEIGFDFVQALASHRRHQLPYSY